jgi:hypothetical protein
MKVRCSGEIYKVIDTEFCLQCAVEMQGEQPCGYGYRLLKAMFKGQEDRSEEVHVTDLTGCLLKAYWDKAMPKIPYVHELLVLWVGRAIHDSLTITDEVVTSEFPISEMNIMGKVDEIYEWGIGDTKTTRWMKPQNLPYGNHADQVNIYRHLYKMGHEVGDKLQIQMIDMSGPTRCKSRKSGVPCGGVMRMIDGVVKCPKCHNTFQGAHLGAMIIDIDINDDETINNFLIERRDILVKALETLRAPDPEPSFLCGYCPHTQCIWNGDDLKKE